MRTGDIVALLVVLALGAPFVFVLTAAFADGEVRRREAPLRALIGGQPYDELLADEDPDQHYLQRPPMPAWLRIFPRNQARQNRRQDRRAPNFSLPTSDGTRWRLSDHRGKVVVMNFWTVTCQPCVEEMPTLIHLAELVRAREGIELVSVTVDRDWETVHTVVPADAPLTVMLDPDRRIVREKFGTRLFPETWIIDPEGVIRLRVDGRRDWSNPVVLDVIESYL